MYIIGFFGAELFENSMCPLFYIRTAVYWNLPVGNSCFASIWLGVIWNVWQKSDLICDINLLPNLCKSWCVHKPSCSYFVFRICRDVRGLYTISTFSVFRWGVCLFVCLFLGFFSQFKLKYLCILPIYSFIFTSKDSDLTLEIYVSITARKISFFQDVTSMKNLTPVSHYGKTPLKNFWVWATKTWYILFTEYVFTLFWVIELWAVNLPVAVSSPTG